MKKLFGLLLPALLLAACYSPEPFEAESAGSASSQKSDIGTMYFVNGNENVSWQICNPSVSQDTVNFPGAMLWLNFGTDLYVTPPDSEYTVSKSVVERHDRLSISDTAGKVLWYMMRDTAEGECQFQDPEWSTHADYAVALRAYDKKKKNQCLPENLDYGMFAVRLSDKKKFWFFDKDIRDDASPHLWVSPGASVTEDADSTMEGFFGTSDVRLVYTEASDKDALKTDRIVFVDFAAGGIKKAKTFKLPAGHNGWGFDAPLISPDGKFVVYNVFENSSTWEAYIQELAAGSEPIKIERTKDMISEPAQPHWFEYNGRLFVLWAEFPAGKPMLNKENLTMESAQDGSVGRTVMREIRLTAGAPKDIAVEWLGDTRVVATIPMTGGRSPDGRFLATGTNNGYLLELP